MRKTLDRSPAEFVRAPLPDQRLRELWAGVERAELEAKTRKQRVRQAAAGAAALGAVMALLVLVRSWNAAAPVATLAPISTEIAADGPHRLSLQDGSTLSLIGKTRAHVVTASAREVRLRLEQGKIECEVSPDPGRRFIVEAGELEVVVTGTRFTVSVDGDDAGPERGVAVNVERGSVEIWQPPQRVLASLQAGQLWASARRNDVPVPGSAGAPSTTGASPASAPSHAAAPSSAVAPSSAPPSPRALFARASEARLAGNTRDAAAALEELRRRYPGDERAGYAAFMLGRLRLDTLGDAQGAVDAFSFAVAHPGSGFFLEDAEARLVEALARAGHQERCLKARERFLQSHPESPAASLVAKQCEAQ